MKRLVFLLLLFSVAPAAAHEVRPAYLELQETGVNTYQVLWKIPMRGDRRLAIEPVLSGQTERTMPVVTREQNGAAVQTWHIRMDHPLRGRTVNIEGLEDTMTDALVRLEFLDGTTWIERLTPAQPVAVIPLQPDGWTVSGDYLVLGVEHILMGIDHLLFVLALLFLTGTGWTLVKTVTAFTAAHSITLAAATLGLVRVPVAPVEAVIALSIVFVAVEIVHAGRGRDSLALRAPWIVAFTFGLLHGFGFAGALSEVGLPQGHIPLALLFFNLGVEAGQLGFVAAVLAVRTALRSLQFPLPSLVSTAPAYAIGTVAMFWVLQRVTGF